MGLQIAQFLLFALGTTPAPFRSVDAFSLVGSSPKPQYARAAQSCLFSSVDGTVDPNTYNVDLDTAVNLMTASVQQDNSKMRPAGIPFIDATSKDYFVDDVDIVVSRDGGMGMELLELAGGREDGFGITVVTKVSGNAAKAGVVPGDSIAAVSVTSSKTEGNNLEESTKMAGCECLDFDRTMDVLANFPGDASEVKLSLKRIRRWPKLKVTVQYPPVQVAEGVDNKEELELFAGENLHRALLNRGIVFEDPLAPKCDFCGGKCTVSVSKGMSLLSPLGMTESKIMKKNPTCRVSFEMGSLRLKKVSMKM
jgi:hypothetical protein